MSPVRNLRCTDINVTALDDDFCRMKHGISTGSDDAHRHFKRKKKKGVQVFTQQCKKWTFKLTCADLEKHLGHTNTLSTT
eukprot:m.56191 g.56191  ORF g.56191 m.56191 type:complete len:80 (+) comp11546_c0_seq1:2679-2918(+)